MLERFHVDGEPRDAELADFDGDGWNELVVAIRDADKVQAYRNTNGLLSLAAEIPVGKSPREMAQADFNGDGCKDFVVVNRQSYDVSVLIACGADAIGFQALGRLYPVDGEVAALQSADINLDGRADVIQLHRASSEVSVRLAQPDGTLGEPTLLPAGKQPNGLDIADVNGDNQPDIITANLGQGAEPGSLTIFLSAQPPGRTVNLPITPSAEDDARLISVKTADFDGDGKVDLAAGFADSRLAFLKGDGQGGFQAVADYSHGYVPFLFAARQFVAGDFDQDGDRDLAGAGYYGELAVVENAGDLLSNPAPRVQALYARELASELRWYRARELRAEAIDGDNDVDLVLGLDAGVAVFYGAEGLAFTEGEFSPGPGVPPQGTLPGTDFSVNGIAFGDFDADGDRDLAVSCLADGCLTILTRQPGGAFVEALKVRVPAAEFVAAGDIDGDGKADLVGSGRTTLWVALSSQGNTPTQIPAPVTRPRLPKVLINEIMAENASTRLTLPPGIVDHGLFPDWIELSNFSFESVDLSGWRLLVGEGANIKTWIAPPGTQLDHKARLLVPCIKRSQNAHPLVSGWALPAEGGRLRLYNAAQVLVDDIAYPNLGPDVAFGRYSDGVSSFCANGMASPGASNVYTGPVKPRIEFKGFDLDSYAVDRPLRFLLSGVDDSALLGASLLWRRKDQPSSELQRVRLYDDGLHNDQGPQDRLFAGTMPAGLPLGAEIEFYIEAVDVSGATSYLPTAPGVSEDAGGTAELYSLAMGAPLPALEISEVVSENDGAAFDEGGGSPDYLEVRNTGDATLDVGGLVLTGFFFTKNERFVFPPATTLAPRQPVIIWCDNNPDQGPFHAPFKINNDGDHLYLSRVNSSSGVLALIDGVNVPPLGDNVAWTRAGARGLWGPTSPTPQQINAQSGQPWCFVSNGTGTAASDEFVLVFATDQNVTHTVETTSIFPGGWQTVAVLPGSGLEKSLRLPITAERKFFRIR
ncbi:MAG: FG-GAP-like repeat-containing protein [Verrucomicrobiales bacterium]